MPKVSTSDNGVVAVCVLKKGSKPENILEIRIQETKNPQNKN